MEKVNKIAVKMNKTDRFEYTGVMPDLINCFEFKSVSIIAKEYLTLHKAKLFGGIEKYMLNKLKAYNSIGFFEANFSKIIFTLYSLKKKIRI